MGSASSKFRKHLVNGDEVAALHLYNNNSDLRKALDPSSSYGDSYQHETPLHYAARHRMKSLLRIFLYDHDSNPNKTNRRKETALHCVCMEKDSQYYTVKRRRAECLTLILHWRGATLQEGEVEKSDLASQDEFMNTPLHHAAASGLKACVELLVQAGAPLFVENTEQETPCDSAEKNGHSEVALYLESKMVFSNVEDDSVIPEIEDLHPVIYTEDYSGLRAQDLQEAKDQLLVETADMLSVPLFTAEALLRNHEWSREMLLEAWMTDPFACCEKSGVSPPASITSSNTLVRGGSSGSRRGTHEDDTGDILCGTGVTCIGSLTQAMEQCGSSSVEFVDELPHMSSPTLSEEYVPSDTDTICEICAMSFAVAEEPVHMCCHHEFCRRCWIIYLNMKIQEGDAHHITCPAYQCIILVPVDVIESLVSREMARKYLQFDIQAFVESNPSIKWCPYPGCSNAVRLPDLEVPSSPTIVKIPSIPSDTSRAVDCGNGHYFCWECLGEAHEPCSCDHWKAWYEKIAEIKPEQLAGTSDETESAANCLWLVTNSKPCPNCKSPIQKNEGCNHMKCTKCKYDFCWVCLEPWKRHNSSTGGYFKCNRFEVVKKVKETTSNLMVEAEARNVKMQELNRFVHYYTRFKNHENSYKFEVPVLHTAKEKMMKLAEAVTDIATANEETKFVEDAIHQLLKARRVLKCSYVYGYYLGGPGYKKIVFEFMQTELEECTEILSQMVNRLYLRTPRKKIIDQATIVQRKRHEFIAAIAKGLVPPETPPSLRKRRRKYSMDLEDEELRKAILASIQDVDPANPWIKDASGRHTNVMAVLDWPGYDSDDSDTEVNQAAVAQLGECSMPGCSRPRAVNPRTGIVHQHCSLRCLRLDQLENTCTTTPVVEPSNTSIADTPTELVIPLDENMQLLRAIEMSRLQYLRDIGMLESNVPCSPESVMTVDNASRELHQLEKSGESNSSDGAISLLQNLDAELQRVLETNPTDLDPDLKLAIATSLKDAKRAIFTGASTSLSRNSKPPSVSVTDDNIQRAKSNIDGSPSSPSLLRTSSSSLTDLPSESMLCRKPSQGRFDESMSTVVNRVPNKSVEDLLQTDLDQVGAEYENTVLPFDDGDGDDDNDDGSLRTSRLSADNWILLSPNGVAVAALELDRHISSVAPSSSSNFGVIKDISVANIHSDDFDKTRDFSSKNLSSLIFKDSGEKSSSVSSGNKSGGESFHVDFSKLSPVTRRKLLHEANVQLENEVVNHGARDMDSGRDNKANNREDENDSSTSFKLSKYSSSDSTVKKPGQPQEPPQKIDYYRSPIKRPSHKLATEHLVSMDTSRLQTFHTDYCSEISYLDVASNKTSSKGKSRKNKGGKSKNRSASLAEAELEKQVIKSSPLHKEMVKQLSKSSPLHVRNEPEKQAVTSSPTHTEEADRKDTVHDNSDDIEEGENIFVDPNGVSLVEMTENLLHLTAEYPPIIKDLQRRSSKEKRCERHVQREPDSTATGLTTENDLKKASRRKSKTDHNKRCNITATEPKMKSDTSKSCDTDNLESGRQSQLSLSNNSMSVNASDSDLTETRHGANFEETVAAEPCDSSASVITRETSSGEFVRSESGEDVTDSRPESERDVDTWYRPGPDDCSIYV